MRLQPFWDLGLQARVYKQKPRLETQLLCALSFIPCRTNANAIGLNTSFEINAIVFVCRFTGQTSPNRRIDDQLNY